MWNQIPTNVTAFKAYKKRFRYFLGYNLVMYWVLCQLKKLFYLIEKSGDPFKVKVALSVPEALEIIKEYEIEKIVRFNVYIPTKDFGSTGKSFCILIMS